MPTVAVLIGCRIVSATTRCELPRGGRWAICARCSLVLSAQSHRAFALTRLIHNQLFGATQPLPRRGVVSPSVLRSLRFEVAFYALSGIGRR